MSEQAPQYPEYVSTREAARITGLSRAWFERARWLGDGPSYVKLDRTVLYPRAALHDWLRARLRTSTSDEAGTRA